MHIHDGSSQGSGWIKNFMFHIKRSFSHVLKPFHEGSRYGSRWIKINRLAENVAAYGFQRISAMGPIMDHDGSRRNGCQDNRRLAFRSMHSVVEYRCCPRGPGLYLKVDRSMRWCCFIPTEYTACRSHFASYRRRCDTIDHRVARRRPTARRN